MCWRRSTGTVPGSTDLPITVTKKSKEEYKTNCSANKPEADLSGRAKQLHQGTEFLQVLPFWLVKIWETQSLKCTWSFGERATALKQGRNLLFGRQKVFCPCLLYSCFIFKGTQKNPCMIKCNSMNKTEEVKQNSMNWKHFLAVCRWQAQNG